MSSQVTKNPASGDKPSFSLAEARTIQALAWPDVWANLLRLEVDAHPFDLRGREYQRQVLRDEHQFIVNPKGAQLGWTTVYLIKCAHAAVIRRKHILYLLPVKAGSVQFVQGRIDPILDSNPKLKQDFSKTDNRVQKQTTSGVNWYIRGTNIETELREVPADILVIDERDKAREDLLPDAFERISGSSYQRVYELSTPTVDGYGVYSEDGWAASDQHRWWVPCPHCGCKQVLSFEENILPWLGSNKWETQCCCAHCHMQITDVERAQINSSGIWVPENTGAHKRGYHLSQLNSPTKRLGGEKGMIENYFLGQQDSKLLKAFYNLALGLPYAAAGDKFTSELLDRCRGAYDRGGIPDGCVYIGVDVGQSLLHVTLWTLSKKKRRLWDVRLIHAEAGRKKWQVFEEDVLRSLNNWVAVIDAHPDKEEVEDLSKRYHGKVWMGFEKDRPDQKETANFMPASYGDPAKINIDRTMAFDGLIKHYMDGNSELPRDARDLGEFLPKLSYNGFYNHHLQMVRVEQPDAQGRMIARWVNGNLNETAKGAQRSGGRPDHWHHSDMFGLIATMIDVPLVIAPEVGSLFKSAGGVMASAT